MNSESVQKQFLLYALRKLNWNTLPLPPYEASLQLIHIDTLKTRRNYAQLSFVNDIMYCLCIAGEIKFSCSIKALNK